MFQIYCFSSDTQDVGEELDVELNAFFFCDGIIHFIIFHQIVYHAS